MRRFDSLGRLVGDRREDWFGVKHFGPEDANYGVPNMTIVGLMSEVGDEEAEDLN